MLPCLEFYSKLLLLFFVEKQNFYTIINYFILTILLTANKCNRNYVLLPGNASITLPVPRYDTTNNPLTLEFWTKYIPTSQKLFSMQDKDGKGGISLDLNKQYMNYYYQGYGTFSHPPPTPPHSPPLPVRRGGEGVNYYYQGCSMSFSPSPILLQTLKGIEERRGGGEGVYPPDIPFPSPSLQF